MGLASALTTALTGLTAAETQIDVVGNNLANSQTVGFKASDTVFSTQFLQTLGLGSAPDANSGGTNPRQTGLGTQVAEITPDFTQGTIEVSSNPSDLAIQGDGFFIVRDSSGEQLYTRNGIFKTNSENQLVTVNGNRLLGYGVDEIFALRETELAPLEIPLGATQVAQATRNVTMEGTFTPSGDVANQAEVIESAVLGDAAVPRADASGTTVAIAGRPEAGATTAANNKGAGTHPENVTYRYRFTYRDTDTNTESTGSEEIAITVPISDGVPNNAVLLDSLPDTTEYDEMNVYRTEADGSEFYFLTTLATANAGGPDQFLDDNSIALDLGTELDEDTINGNYSYLVTYHKAGEVESRPSALLGPQTVVDGRIHLQDLPTPPVPGVDDDFPAYDSVRVYRNVVGDSSSYYLLATLDPGESFTDNVADSEILANTPLDFDGPKADANTLLTNVLVRDELAYEQTFQEGTLSFSARKGGRGLETQTFEITASTTLQEFLDFMENATGVQQAVDDLSNPIPSSVNDIPGDTSGSLAPGASVLSNGKIRFVSNNGVDNAVSIGLSALTLETTDGEIGNSTLGFGTVQDAVGQSTVAEFLAYDSLGTAINVRVTAILEDRNGAQTTYRWFADSPDNDSLNGGDIAVGTGLVRLDSEGNVISTTNTTVSIDRRNVPSASPLEFDLDFSRISGLAAEDSSLAASRQDGSSPGTLTSFTIGEDGIIRGSFSNGISRTLGQIRMARFTNPTGLEQRGQNLFSTGANSGLPVEGNPGENGIGSVIAGAVELSNTDIGQNLIDLVLATTQYRGNTRVITTSQQLLDELLNLRR